MGIFDESTLDDDEMDEFLPKVGQGNRAAPKPQSDTKPDPAQEGAPEGSTADETLNPDDTSSDEGVNAPQETSSERQAKSKKPKKEQDKSEDSDSEGAPTAEISSTNFVKLRNLRLSEQKKNPATARTYGQIVRDAIDNGQQELSKRWKQPANAEKAPGSLFARQPVALKRRKHSSPTAKIALTGLSAGNVATIDEELVGEWGAPSRSALVDEALTLYFKRRRGPVRKKQAAEQQTDGEQHDESTEEQVAS
ncbi:hypothetical protein BKG82_26460 [Mycobacteroides chelonae]|uniref:Uncharacterized protein n=1 Tax=Mycobacteroides chelonae TaxID=1774 RepID=A0A1S1LFZ2_MYCCH|nr:hypothetical protein [Mycobacteroides chelonae]OHU47201.1 hypothetical protein BKG82_26460 [Mycobacteroides chelonae]